MLCIWVLVICSQSMHQQSTHTDNYMYNDSTCMPYMNFAYMLPICILCIYDTMAPHGGSLIWKFRDPKNELKNHRRIVYRSILVYKRIVYR